MKLLKLVAAVSLVVALAGCSRDPEVLKRKYVENGDKYFKNGKYKEASILYRKALAKDAKFGQAYARLAETEIRLGRMTEAVRAYQRAVETLPDNTEAAAKLANIYMGAYVGAPSSQYLRLEIEQLQKVLHKKNPKSFESLRLAGYMYTMDRRYSEAVAALRGADQAKPGQSDVALALAQALIGVNQTEEAGKVVRAALDKNKSYSALYDMLSAIYLKQNRVADAEQVLLLKVKNNPKDIAYRTQLAGFYFATKRTDEVNRTLREILGKANEFPGAYEKVGDFFLRIRDFDRARQTFEQGLQANPAEKMEYRKRIIESLALGGKQGEAMAMVDQLLAGTKDEKDSAELKSIRAALILQSGDRAQLQRAIDDLTSALQKNSKNFVLQYNLGRAYLQKEETDAARVHFLEALKLRPDYTPARLLLAQAYLTRREFAKAIQTAGEVLSQDSTNLSARLIRSAALLGSGEYSQARKEIEDTVAAYPNSRDAQFQLAMLNLSERKLGDSEKAFQGLLKKDEGDPRGVLGLVETHMAAGRTQQAQQLLLEELKKNPARDEMRLALANVAFRSQAYRVAIENYRQLVDKNPKSSEMWLRLAIALARAQRFDEAHKAFEKTLALKPSDAMAHVERAMLFEAEGKSQQAKPAYHEVLKLQPDNPVALNNLAYIMAEEGKDLDQALTYAQRAKQKLPGNPDISDTLGWVYIKKNLSDNAIQIFRELVNKNPGNPTFHYHLALALAQKGDKGQAKRELDAALRLNPDKGVETKIRELLARVS